MSTQLKCSYWLRCRLVGKRCLAALVTALGTRTLAYLRSRIILPTYLTTPFSSELAPDFEESVNQSIKESLGLSQVPALPCIFALMKAPLASPTLLRSTGNHCSLASSRLLPLGTCSITTAYPPRPSFQQLFLSC